MPRFLTKYVHLSLIIATDLNMLRRPEPSARITRRGETFRLRMLSYEKKWPQGWVVKLGSETTFSYTSGNGILRRNVMSL